jgi:hypothetical protein
MSTLAGRYPYAPEAFFIVAGPRYQPGIDPSPPGGDAEKASER